MSLPVDFAICIIAWSVPILRFRYVWASRAWKRDYVALNIWLATLSFAVTVTFLFDQLGDAFDSITTNNLSTYLAYCGVILTLYFTTTASLYIPQTARSERIRRLLVVFLITSLAAVSFFYWVFIYGLPQWRRFRHVRADVHFEPPLPAARKRDPDALPLYLDHPDGADQRRLPDLESAAEPELSLSGFCVKDAVHSL
jgi:hypothetical protein